MGHWISFTGLRLVQSYHGLNIPNEARCHCGLFLSLISQNNRCRVRCAGGKLGTHQAEAIKCIYTLSTWLNLHSVPLCSNTARNNTFWTNYRNLLSIHQEDLDTEGPKKCIHTSTWKMLCLSFDSYMITLWMQNVIIRNECWRKTCTVLYTCREHLILFFLWHHYFTL